MKGISTEDAQMLVESLENSLEIYTQWAIDYEDWNDTKKDGWEKFDQQKCNAKIASYKDKIIRAELLLKTVKTWI